MGVPELLQDFYFLGGALLLLGSIGGIFWILKLMHGEKRASRAEEARAADPTVLALQNFSAQLNRLEETLLKMDQKLAQSPSGQDLATISQEVKAILQHLKSSPGAPAAGAAAPNPQIAAKIDKIYQVLTSLAGSSEPK